MKSSEGLHGAIVSVIERHCKSIPSGPNGPIDSFAIHVALAHRHRHQLVNKSDDVDNMRELKEALSKAVSVLSTATEATLYDLSNATPEIDTSIEQYKASLNSLLAGVKTLRKRSHYKFPASSKQDYEALAVVWACSKIWREHLNPDEVSRWDEVSKKVPKTLQRNRINQPFFRFIEDMFEVFSIETLPSSALSALQRAGGEEKLKLSLEVR